MPEPVAIALISAVGLVVGAALAAIPGVVSAWRGGEAKKQEINIKLEEVQSAISDRVWQRAKDQFEDMDAEIRELREIVVALRAELDAEKEAAAQMRTLFERERSALQQDLNRLKASLDRERRRSQTFRDGVYILIRQLQEAEITPKWNPPPNGDEG